MALIQQMRILKRLLDKIDDFLAELWLPIRFLQKFIVCFIVRE